jgi:hypothetical protein
VTVIRILNESGIQRFRDYVAAAKVDSTLVPPFELLEDGKFSEPFTQTIEIEKKQFANAYEFGVYLNAALSGCTPRDISRNHALWSWLALFFFDEIAKPNSSGQRKILEEAVYILDATFKFQRYYRHVVRTPWLAVLKHGQHAKVLLIASGGGTRTEVNEQLGAFPDLFGCNNIIASAYEMYFDVDAQKPKKGSSGKGPGTPRRLSAVVRQLQLTYDLDDCSIADFLNLLPQEFSRWANKTP